MSLFYIIGHKFFIGHLDLLPILIRLMNVTINKLIIVYDDSQIPALVEVEAITSLFAKSLIHFAYLQV